MGTDLGLGGWVEGKGLHVAGDRMAGWDYGGRFFFIFFHSIFHLFQIKVYTKQWIISPETDSRPS